MLWKGKEIKTIGDAMEALEGIHTKEDAAEYLQLARLEGEYADQNIGYLFGYFSRERLKELTGLFGIPHPVFGYEVTMTDEEILRNGMERGKAAAARAKK